MADRKKPGWVFWTTVIVVGVPVLYVLSFGPACWWFAKPIEVGSWAFSGSLAVDQRKMREASKAYWPLGWLVANGPTPVHRVLGWYALLGTDVVVLPTDSSGAATLMTRSY